MAALLRILFLCLVVGFLLSWFAIDPRSLLTGSLDAVRDVARLALSLGSWAIPYILLGATVVVPIAVIGAVLKLLDRRRRDP
ncbi:hypothetical protein [Arenibaculum pallidiluteum]|uniref:hypothetical protein n=1 Tax=Arenibaculum pallidiluteum TaxID=2812559 RepID=UPI001A96F2E6|nr:hypothetical protein [Arenibaculum pallidiluteum]